MTDEPRYSVSLTRVQWLALCALAENYVLLSKDSGVSGALAEIYAALDKNIPAEEVCCRYPYPPGMTRSERRHAIARAGCHYPGGGGHGSK